MQLVSIEGQKEERYNLHNECFWKSTVSVLSVKRDDGTTFSLKLSEKEQQALYKEIERVVVNFVKDTYIPDTVLIDTVEDIR